MLFGVILTLHIIGACITGAVGIAALVHLALGKGTQAGGYATTLGAIAGFEVLTGTMLMLLSDGSSFLVCRNIVLYLTAVVAIQIALMLRMRQTSLVFPLLQALAPIAASLVMASALAYGA